MRIQRCFVCNQIKSSTEFFTKEMCNECYKYNKRIPKKRTNKATSDNQKKREESNQIKKTIPTRTINVTSRLNKLKKDTAKIIMLLLEDLAITEIPGFEEINVSNLNTKELLNHYSFEELASLLSILEYYYQHSNK